jgi:hypothetical protein
MLRGWAPSGRPSGGPPTALEDFSPRLLLEQHALPRLPLGGAARSRHWSPHAARA